MKMNPYFYFNNLDDLAPAVPLLLILAIPVLIWANYPFLKQFFDRNYNLIFHRKKCIRIIMSVNWYKYNDVIHYIPNHKLRHLGKNWYKILE